MKKRGRPRKKRSYQRQNIGDVISNMRKKTTISTIQDIYPAEDIVYERANTTRKVAKTIRSLVLLNPDQAITVPVGELTGSPQGFGNSVKKVISKLPRKHALKSYVLKTQPVYKGEKSDPKRRIIGIRFYRLG